MREGYPGCDIESARVRVVGVPKLNGITDDTYSV